MVLSLLILVHLAAVFAPPMAFQSRGPRGLSPAVARLLGPLAAYGQFLYLDRGYAFFAPDPGPSHLLRVQVGSALNVKNETSSDGVADVESSQIHWYPDLHEQWPRLLYHRNFMLAEFLNDAYQPKLPAEAASLVGPEMSIEELRIWRTGRSRYELILGSMTHHLSSEFGNSEVKIDRVEHLLPDFVEYVADPTPLNDPATYVVLEDFPISMEVLLDVPAEMLPPASSIGRVPRGSPNESISITDEATPREDESNVPAGVDSL